MLGQPLPVGALKQSIKQATPKSVPQAAPEAIPQVASQTSTPPSSCPPSPFSLFGKGRNSKNREVALQTIAKDLRESFSSSDKKGYTRIPDDGAKVVQNSPTKQRTSSFSYQASPFHDGNRKPLTAEDFPPIE